MPKSSARHARRRIQTAAIALAAVLAGACGGSKTPTGPTPPPGTTPPPALTVACPANVSATSTAGGPVPVEFAAPTTTGGVAPVTVSCRAPSGDPFPVGATPVTCTATDAGGQTASCTFTVTVTFTPPPPRLSRTKFLAFGDSLTAGEVTSPLPSPAGAAWFHSPKILVPAASYPTQLLTLLQARYTTQQTALSVTNAGQSGERAQLAVSRFTREVATVRPEVVLILQGFNDLNLLGQAGVVPAAEAIDRMAKEARGRGALVYLATLTPPRPGGRSALRTELVASLNAWVREIARGEGAVLVDLHAALSTDVTRFIGVDGLHPNEAGYRRMAEAFFEAIQANLEVR